MTWNKVERGGGWCKADSEPDQVSHRKPFVDSFEGIRRKHCTSQSSHSTEADHKVEQGCNVNMGERCFRLINNMLLLGVSHWHGSYTPRSFMASLTMS